MRYEQTYNLINFDNKLKGLEDHPEYPKEKPWRFRETPDSSADYNILSNIPLAQHHYAHPKNRPQEKKAVENLIYNIYIYICRKK